MRQELVREPNIEIPVFLIFIVISYGALVSANPVTFVNGSDVNVVENIEGPVLIVEALASQAPGCDRFD